MSHASGSKAEQWSARIQDILADNSKIRQGLHDEDAIPYIEWGVDLASGLGRRIARPDTPDLDAQQVSEVGFGLSKLMLRLNWLVTYRHKKDEAWLKRTFAMVNKLSGDLWGDDAPVMDDEQITAWLAGHADHTDGELIRDLMRRFTPPALVQDAATDTPPPLSNAVFGPLDGASQTDESDKPATPGENNGEKIE